MTIENEPYKCYASRIGDRDACEDLREVFKLKCPPMWVNHFDRKYDYINFKKKLYSEGADSVDQKFEEKR